MTDLDRAKRFYRDVLGLRELQRPPFDFPGAWFAIGAGQVHLIVHDGATFRGAKGVDSRDAHFAVRVASFAAALEHLRNQGYSERLDDGDPMRLKVSPHATAGFPQIYVLDPDRNVVEINAERLDA